MVACAGSPPAPVEDRQYGGASPGAGYRVQQGDTLYSIAFRYGLDYRRLGAANGISAPYTIYPGQRLRLSQADIPKTASSSATRKESATAVPPSPGVAPASPVLKPPPQTPKKAPASKHTQTAVVSRPVANAPVKAWRWPSSGPVVRRYSATVHKGIDIGGKRGDPVQAVAAGQVVYAGNGIVGLGELIIVKHNELYLSAYGHNDRLLVAEGAVVQAGQRIAEKGSSGTDSVRLHFEIRKEGKPIDPLRLLPRR
ncbi:peptidoglycan DD-metalloendopeptidase family protein [Pseudohalioglobus lutimaris]|uniref:LysM peptidoglycan-binding domain-containing protein n=1 Tax=Pseudohalioglobus lutimaris TaxID=1737061 RepID=A0A2N5X0V5_9GAMM|nr:peptidoglycan DD-metalloendopeptidase family protein [Pseudohalioglobus lutimaris]PLW68132.1 LysM peptidoglycan-binding domain-containing protein [Pseudohalioglobus lutimaris]